MKIVALAAMFLIYPNVLWSQGGLSITGGIEFDGVNYGYQFQQNGTVLLPKNLRRGTSGSGSHVCGFSPQLNLGAQYRFSRFFALEMGIGMSELDLMVNDSYFLNKYLICLMCGRLMGTLIS